LVVYLIISNIEIALQLVYSGEVSPETPQIKYNSRKCYLVYQQDVQGEEFSLTTPEITSN